MTLAAVSPAGPVDPDDFHTAVQTIEQAGFSIRSMPHVLNRAGFLAGSDEERCFDLHEAFRDPDVDAVLCTRGGYGSMRLLPLLDYDLIASNPKPMIGFSDITSLQWALQQRIGLISFTGPQLVKGWGEKLDAFSRDTWLDMLAGRLWGSEMPLPGKDKSLQVERHGYAKGPLAGGNLAVIAAMCGTGNSPQFSDCILLLEEIDEPPYRIDRTLTQLAHAGAFEGVAGVLLGGFVQHAQGGRKDWTRLAANRIMELIPGVPVLSGAPYAHVPPFWTLPLGAWMHLDAERGRVICEVER
ncbi:LD-carboxypeptidase [bacterium]|nr:LD-carboxypeptidase [bacterium]